MKNKKKHETTKKNKQIRRRENIKIQRNELEEDKVTEK